MADPRYKRVLLKISGEALMGAQDYGMEPAMVARIAGEVKSVHALGGQGATADAGRGIGLDQFLEKRPEGRLAGIGRVGGSGQRQNRCDRQQNRLQTHMYPRKRDDANTPFADAQ